MAHHSLPGTQGTSIGANMPRQGAPWSFIYRGYR